MAAGIVESRLKVDLCPLKDQKADNIVRFRLSAVNSLAGAINPATVA
jgi:hypothetical protein